MCGGGWFVLLLFLLGLFVCLGFFRGWGLEYAGVQEDVITTSSRSIETDQKCVFLLISEEQYL